MDFSKYKAILFDVDKTLTNSDKQITQATKNALKSLSEKGLVTGVCTGRQFVTLEPMIQGLFPESSIHICAGGGEITKTTGEVIFQKKIDATIVHTLYELTQTISGRMLLQSGDKLYGNEKAIGRPSQVMRYPLTDLDDWSSPLVVIAETTEDFVEKLRSIPVHFKQMINYSNEKYVDVTAQGVNKSFGIMRWSNMTGIQPSEIIGFGDSENDIEFLETVGYAVAMGNATSEVQAIADEVTDDCDHDGVASWIEKNILST